ncbi:uncharacterized protein LOC120353654 [Nilaparvata lugens]|uniref:uncharacterized protein LOC120353654 n=1 Tax=Nilaparvata lugens TaxID=108931 RepID=UPI00193D07D6|nr:uncharacterized protein LOC120353654 [Nilaparvata lugens]
MAGRSDALTTEEIANILDGSFFEGELCSDNEDGLEESGHDSVSEIFGDDSDKDPDFVPNEPQQRDESADAYDSSENDEESHNEIVQPVNDEDDPAIRLAGRAVVLISSMHHDGVILNDREGKLPEIIDFYNITKVGVDSLDQKCAQFSVSRRTQRWPMTVCPDLAPSDFHLFPKMKTWLATQRFDDDADLRKGVTDWLASQFYDTGISKLVHRYDKKCLNLFGDNVEK